MLQWQEVILVWCDSSVLAELALLLALLDLWEVALQPAFFLKALRKNKTDTQTEDGVRKGTRHNNSLRSKLQIKHTLFHT